MIDAYIYAYEDSFLDSCLITSYSEVSFQNLLSRYIKRVSEELRGMDVFRNIYFAGNYTERASFLYDEPPPPGRSVAVGVHLTCNAKIENVGCPINVILKDDDYETLRENIKSLLRSFTRNPVVADSVAVFDLDETIIDRDYNILPGAAEFLLWVRSNVSYVVLWSHGSYSHVNETQCSLNNLSRDMFDVIICSEMDTSRSRKYLGRVLRELNEEYCVTKINYSVLFDDKRSNNDLAYNVFGHIPSNIFSIPTLYSKAKEVVGSRIKKHRQILLSV